MSPIRWLVAALEAPVNTLPASEKFWWNDDWYLRGKLNVPVNHDVVERATSYINPIDGTEIPAILYRPKGQGEISRRSCFNMDGAGLMNWCNVCRAGLAARGFVSCWLPMYMMQGLSKNFPWNTRAKRMVMSLPGSIFCLSNPIFPVRKSAFIPIRVAVITRLQAAVKFKHQQKNVACYASSYPHWQNPNAVEPAQVYRYAKELDSLTIPTMVFIGEYEQYQRRRSIETAVKFMKQAGRDIKLVIYPGVGRGFDFRPPWVRTFADDLATKDQIVRLDAFFRRHLAKWSTK